MDSAAAERQGCGSSLVTALNLACCTCAGAGLLPLLPHPPCPLAASRWGSQKGGGRCTLNESGTRQAVCCCIMAACHALANLILAELQGSALALAHLSKPTVHLCWLMTPTMPGSAASLRFEAALHSSWQQAWGARCVCPTPGTLMQCKRQNQPVPTAATHACPPCPPRQHVCPAPVQQLERLGRRRRQPWALPRLKALEGVGSRRQAGAGSRRARALQLAPQLALKATGQGVVALPLHGLYRRCSTGHHLEPCAGEDACIGRGGS